MTSGKVPAKAFAVFAVALMMIVSIVPLLSVEKEVDAADTGEFSVTYYSNNGDDKKTVYYHGIGSAEYNPEIDWGWTGNTYTKDLTFNGTLIIDFNKSVDNKEFVIPQGVVLDTSNATFTHDKVGAPLYIVQPFLEPCT